MNIRSEVYRALEEIAHMFSATAEEMEQATEWFQVHFFEDQEEEPEEETAKEKRYMARFETNNGGAYRLIWAINKQEAEEVAHAYEEESAGWRTPLKFQEIEEVEI